MPARYSFQIDPRRNLVRMELHGFFSPDEIAAFDHDRRVAYRQLRCGPNDHVTLVDMRGTHIQSQEAVQHFQRLLSLPDVPSRKIAFLVARSLARLQIKRAAGEREADFFEDPVAAEEWLDRHAAAREGAPLPLAG